MIKKNEKTFPVAFALQKGFGGGFRQEWGSKRLSTPGRVLGTRD